MQNENTVNIDIGTFTEPELTYIEKSELERLRALEREDIKRKRVESLATAIQHARYPVSKPKPDADVLTCAHAALEWMKANPAPVEARGEKA